ncbi:MULTISPECIES: hypothetical protein [unclassified Haloferax]|uniref:DUF7123 family protein n=1 Tax=Haloferax TaxID=2251 RepID=UPI0002AF9622|nr:MULTISPECIES: hypothetical protein [unclassified Haloferax]ELZ57107.1 hypothetical protein C460_12936 [Haloferax sp. ATCC BAA-646]ELZ68475.1 hypothetical protein C459_00140 [Haloferax sp. ATCC BAA-645]ELZ68806.1 hypothetical protein C458_08067 [Haloferax sp. ATCC BAA-644]
MSSDSAPSKRDRLEQYLSTRASEGAFYFKSRHITDEVGLSSKEIGALVELLQREAETLHISRWGYARSTSWYVEPAD